MKKKKPWTTNNVEKSRQKCFFFQIVMSPRRESRLQNWKVLTGFDLTLGFQMLLEYRSVVELLEYCVYLYLLYTDLRKCLVTELTNLALIDDAFLRISFCADRGGIWRPKKDKNGMRNDHSNRLTWDLETRPGNKPEKRVSLNPELRIASSIFLFRLSFKSS